MTTVSNVPVPPKDVAPVSHVVGQTLADPQGSDLYVRPTSGGNASGTPSSPPGTPPGIGDQGAPSARIPSASINRPGNPPDGVPK